jgi:hypothetical protein
MTETNDVATAYRRHQQALSQANKLNKDAVFDALSAANVTSVLADFDGEGDSGQINNIAAYANGEIHEIPAVTVEIHRAPWAKDKLDSVTTTLHDAIETLCYDTLSEEHDGWENNDGAFGEFTFNVAKRSIELEFNGRFSDVVTTHHTL